jgi:hypothetical protein
MTTRHRDSDDTQEHPRDSDYTKRCPAIKAGISQCTRPFLDCKECVGDPNPSKKRRDAWKWTTCKGCKLKKLCNTIEPYMPNCGRDYDEELAEEHDAQVAAKEREKVLDEATSALDSDACPSSADAKTCDGDCVRCILNSLRQREQLK